MSMPLAGNAPPRRGPGAAPWYRHPLVWFCLAIPGSAVVMGVFLIYLSIDSYDGLVSDDYYERGLQIDRVLERDIRARALGLSAELGFAPGTPWELVLSGTRHEAAWPDELVLALLHPTRAGLDRELVLRRVGPARYRGAPAGLGPGRWHAQLSGPDWRLTGRLQVPGAAALVLRPAGDE